MMSSASVVKPMRLDKVLGLTINERTSFICQPNSENLICTADYIVIVSNPRLGTQQHLLIDDTNTTKQSIKTLAISENGRFLAAATCHPNATQIHLWNLGGEGQEIRSEAKLATGGQHKGQDEDILCMCFSPNHQFLVSIGSNSETQVILNVWDWRQERLVAQHSSNSAVGQVRAVSFASDGSYFVTVGEAHLKYWYLQCQAVASKVDLGTKRETSEDNDENMPEQQTIINIEVRGARLGDQRRASFCDVKCGRGSMSGSTFCITKSGFLCELNNQRVLHKWVDLRVARANCLSVSANLITVACANGVVRCFTTKELKFLKNLPRPNPLPGQQQSPTENGSRGKTEASGVKRQVKYPDVIQTALDEARCSIACAYADNSIYLWHFSDLNFGQITRRYSTSFHSRPVWGLDMYPLPPPLPSLGMQDNNSQQLAPSAFITCSSDSLRVWMSSNLPHSTREFSSKIVFTNDKFLSDDAAEFAEVVKKSDDCGENDNNYCDGGEGLRCLKMAPVSARGSFGRHLAVGSTLGTIRIFDLYLQANGNDRDGGQGVAAKEIKAIAAHDAEILDLEYSNPASFSGFLYLASASRDKLIHLFDAHNNYQFLQTIDDHLSSITALRFINNRARATSVTADDDTLQLASCGADQRIIFRNGTRVHSGGLEQLEFVSDQVIEGKSSFHDMEVDSESSCLMAACQDQICLFNLARVKYLSSFNGTTSPPQPTSTTSNGCPATSDSRGGTLIKLVLDPSCTFLAASSTNKTVSIYDYQRGECIASNCLSDLVTDMKFSPDGSRLFASSNNGSIFIWKSPAEIVNAVNTALTNSHNGLRTHLSSSQPAAATTKFKTKAPNSLLLTTVSGNGGEDAEFELGPASLYQEPDQEDTNGPRSLVAAPSTTLGVTDYDDEDGENYYASIKVGAESVKNASTSSMDRHTLAKTPHLLMVQRQSDVDSAIGTMLTSSSSPVGAHKQHQRRHHLGDHFDQQSYNLDNDDDDADSELSSVRQPGASGYPVRPITPPKWSSLNRHKIGQQQARRNSMGQSNASGANELGYQQSSWGANTTGRNGRWPARQKQRQASGDGGGRMMRSSKSECDLMHAGSAAATELPTCEKLDLANVELDMVCDHLSELCQYVVDELQTCSKFATRLHQRLLQNSQAGSLAGSSHQKLLARGIQNSMDILSIVQPPRNRSEQQQYQQPQTPNRFQSQMNPSPAALNSMRRKQNQSQVKSLLRSNSSGLVNALDQNSLARPVEPRMTNAGSARTQLASSSKTNGDGNDSTLSRQANNVSVDQVLEAYSDRLFRMVQDKLQSQQRLQPQLQSSVSVADLSNTARGWPQSTDN